MWQKIPEIAKFLETFCPMGVFDENFSKKCRAFVALLLSQSIFTPKIILLPPFFPAISSQKINGFAQGRTQGHGAMPPP